MDVEPTNAQIEVGKRLVRVGGDKGLSLGERISNHFHRLTWTTPLHALRLKGRFPLKLLAVPTDPVPGNRNAGQWLLSGTMRWQGETVAIDDLDMSGAGYSAGFSDYLQRFEWLRDLAATGARAQAAPVAERLMRKWLAAHGDHVSDAAWRMDLCGWRIMNWAAHAPLILSSTDLIYRSAVLNALARMARHLDRGADRAPQGNARVAAWIGVVAAGLLIPGGDHRLLFGEAGLQRAITTGFSEDGGTIARSPNDQIDAILLLAMLAQIYDARRRGAPDFVETMKLRAVAALLGITMGDGALSSWQGSGPIAAERIEQVVAASAVRTRPLRQARDWGYQRLAAGGTVMVMDAAPPPASRFGGTGCASTLAFELSDGVQRLIVNCGGAGGGTTIPDELARGLRTTAAHSTLTLGDSNSTAILADGRMGQGVNAIEIDRQELDGGSRIDASHDGYARRYGFIHKRTLALSGNGRELRGEDALLPTPRRRRRVSGAAFAIRFHLAPGVEVTPTADGQAALLRIDHGPLWQFRCRGGTLSVEESIWVDAAGRPRPTVQFVVAGVAPPGGASVGWLLKRAG
ncbi:heparinase II/III family protein [Sphingomonas sp.]|uniref:heparinase II/III family protein n=1 Tax=Sphingomonas sp. TaxID=28214 RepID=UPI0025F093BF|nr:heparinase II/III family protein [Sphingomonas sp.]